MSTEEMNSSTMEIESKQQDIASDKENSSGCSAVETPTESQNTLSKTKKKNKNEPPPPLTEKEKLKLARHQRKMEKMAAMKGGKLSGKWWKDSEIRTKFSTTKNSIFKKKSKSLKDLQRQEIQAVKERKNQILAEKRSMSEHRRERRKINIERTLENRKKAEIVQVIKDPRKIKTMKKKQLRQVEKRDISSLNAKNIQK